MKNPHSILFLIDSLTEGGAELALLVLVQTLCKRNFKVSVFAYREPTRLAIAFSESGATLYLPETGTSESRFKAFVRLKKVLLNDYFDFVHASSRNTSMFLALGFLLPRHGHRIVTFQNVHFCRISGLNWWQRFKESSLLTILRLSCHGFTTDSKTNIAEYNKYSPKIPIIFLANCVVPPINITQFELLNARACMGINISDFVIIVPARYSIQKGHIYLFKAIKQLILRGVMPPKVICFGEGDQFTLLSKYIEDNKLGNIISLNNIVTINQLQIYMLAADLVAIPSLWESFGQVVVGAMALGKPVLGSDTGGIKEQIQHEVTGFLAPPGDVEAWSFEIERLMNSSTLLMNVGKSAKNSVRNKLAPMEIATKLIEYYGTLQINHPK